MKNNNVTIKRTTLWKGAVVILIVTLVFFAFWGGLRGSPIGDVTAAGNNNIQSAKLYMKNYEYLVEPAVLKKSIPVRMTVDVNSLIGCAKNVVIKDFGVRKSVSKGNNIIEFTPDKTGTIGIACSMNMYRGTFTVID